jgi:hypothetical protein
LIYFILAGLAAIIIIAASVVMDRDSARDIAVRRTRNRRRDRESVNQLPPENASIRDSEKS